MYFHIKRSSITVTFVMGRKKTKDIRHSSGTGEQRVKGKFLKNLSVSSTSGLFVYDRLELDTTLCTTWSSLGSTFRFWKLHSLKMEIIPFFGVNNTGVYGIMVQPDPDAGLPTDITHVSENQNSRVDHMSKRVSLTYRPYGAADKWFYTKDYVSSDDRLEMPGEIIVASQHFTTACGAYCEVSYEVSFKGTTSSNISTLVDREVERRLRDLVKTNRNDSPLISPKS